MDTLNDDELLIIFKMLNLNERTHLRLLSKRFKCLVDTIKIYKLIIYQQLPALAGHLAYTDEPYGILDTVEVYDLDKFFNNPTILDQMKPIRQLVIEGCGNKITINLNATFGKLNYLRVQGITFTSSSLLQSTELEHLILESTFQVDPSKHGIPVSAFKYQFNELKSGKIKYLKMRAVEFEFLEHCVKNGIFSSLEEIDITFFNFESLLLLNIGCPALKIVNFQVGEDKKALFREVDVIQWTSEQLRDDLSVYLFGM